MRLLTLLGNVNKCISNVKCMTAEGYRIEDIVEAVKTLFEAMEKFSRLNAIQKRTGVNLSDPAVWARFFELINRLDLETYLKFWQLFAKLSWYLSRDVSTLSIEQLEDAVHTCNELVKLLENIFTSLQSSQS